MMKSILFLNIFIFPFLALGQPERPNAAFIIGGYLTGPTVGVLNHTELYGCGGEQGSTVTIRTADFPSAGGVYLTGATYVKDSDGGYVLACAGYICGSDDLCGLSSQCHSWRPEENVWREHSSLRTGRYAHALVKGPNIHDPKGDLPIVMGYRVDTEIADLEGNIWEDYMTVSQISYSLDCMVQHGDKVYSVRNTVTELDLTTWDSVTLAEVPRALQNPNKCSMVTIDGVDGIFVRYGYWFNLETQVWEVKQAPPYNPITTAPNAMWQFRGKPTIFGNPNCGENGVCENNMVFQYEPETDSWTNLGQMLQHRRFHEVVEVPASFCDRFVPYY